MNESPEETIDMTRYIVTIAGIVASFIPVGLYINVKKITKYDLYELNEIMNDDVDEGYAKLIIKLRNEADFLISLIVVILFWFIYSIIFY